MANVEKMEQVFNELLKKFEAAAQAREWQNAVRGNEYDRNKGIVVSEKKAFAKRFAEAKAEEV